MVRLGAFALIFNSDGDVLVGHRGDLDAWNLPSGQVEQGESPWEAAIRCATWVINPSASMPSVYQGAQRAEPHEYSCLGRRYRASGQDNSREVLNGLES